VLEGLKLAHELSHRQCEQRHRLGTEGMQHIGLFPRERAALGRVEQIV
jgi:hypothetical protein